MTTFNQRTYSQADSRCFVSQDEQEKADKILKECVDKPLRKLGKGDYVDGVLQPKKDNHATH